MNKKKKRLTIFLLYAVFFVVLFSLFNREVVAVEISELRGKIDTRSQEIQKLEEEIKKYETLIEETSQKSKSLSRDISVLNTQVKKMEAQLKLTNGRIAQTTLEIQELTFDIDFAVHRVHKQENVSASLLRGFAQLDDQSLVEILLAHNALSDFSLVMANLESIESQLIQSIRSLRDFKKELESERVSKEQKQEELSELKIELEDRSTILRNTKQEKDRLLRDTKNQEVQYQNLLQDRLEKQGVLEEEIRAIEEQIRITIDPQSLPNVGTGVLGWPLDSITITQYFGNTPFASKNPQVYNGRGHNGVDFRASVGAPVKSAESGIVVATGNTDTACRGVSYGRWVLIKHPNNISTLYAHLSLIRVSQGQQIQRGELIGYTGNSGFTTGPHLHFTAYAANAVEVSQIRSRICGTFMTLPIAPYNGYLNPLSYL